MTESILITGIDGGLGSHCHKYFQDQKWKVFGYKRTTEWNNIADLEYDVILHAAYNPRKDITTSNLSAYLNDTLTLTQKLLALKHKKFVFISTCDVYPKINRLHTEDEEISLSDCDSIYSISKLMCEEYVKRFSNQWLILRPTALLGRNIKPNSLMKILSGTPQKLSLKQTSEFNYILHNDITSFIAAAFAADASGIYNLASSANISLAEIAEAFTQPNIHFGDYEYKTGNIVNGKAIQLLPDLNRHSLESIQRFLSLL